MGCASMVNSSNGSDSPCQVMEISIATVDTDFFLVERDSEVGVSSHGEWPEALILWSRSSCYVGKGGN